MADEDLGTLIATYLKLPFVRLSKIQIPEDAFILFRKESPDVKKL